jgi:hypothetical protein
MLRCVFADLARIALVAAAYPLTIANSIASCIWNNPVDSLPQSPTCTALRIDRLDLSSAYASCGPPAIQSDRCCDVLLALASASVFDFVDRTGHNNFEVSSGATEILENVSHQLADSKRLNVLKLYSTQKNMRRQSFQKSHFVLPTLGCLSFTGFVVACFLFVAAIDN